jgi:ARG and Rhodanese-Phosphatase-superfamily-associated Protein domain
VPKPNTIAQADLPNPITAALTDVLVGPESSFNRLSVVPLISRVPPAAPPYVTLDEALAGGNFEITEISDAGRVPELHVLNMSNQPVLMLDGEELVGAKQNRIVNLTILVPAKTNLPIPVTCVEAGRWRHRSREFSSSGHAHYAHARAHKVAQVTASLAQTGKAQSDQQWIWADIAAKAERLAAHSDTAAMSQMYEAHQPSIDEYVTGFRVIDGQRGAVFLLDGKPVGLDLFESDVVLRKLMPKLLRSHALDALDTFNAPAPKHIGAASRRDAAKAFVVSVASAAQGHGRIFPTVGLGETMRVDDGAGAAAALLLDGRVIHLAAFDLGHA